MINQRIPKLSEAVRHELSNHDSSGYLYKYNLGPDDRVNYKIKEITDKTITFTPYTDTDRVFYKLSGEQTIRRRIIQLVDDSVFQKTIYQILAVFTDENFNIASMNLLTKTTPFAHQINLALFPSEHQDNATDKKYDILALISSYKASSRTIYEY